MTGLSPSAADVLANGEIQSGLNILATQSGVQFYMPGRQLLAILVFDAKRRTGRPAECG
jgi:hypothetical protein